MLGRLADLFRLFWGLLYWNYRKSLFRLRRGRMRCPCQSPSDSGRAFETTCEASLTWNRQERFRRVCPLLQRDAAGHLKCSVNTPDVRPFWGRALMISGGTVLALYLALTIAAFAFLRGVGYRVSYVMVAWPPRWAERDRVRGDYFFEKARRAIEQHNSSEALIAYSLAYQYDPKNFVAGLSLAQLSQPTQPLFADQIYARLLHDHPDRRVYVLTGWYQTLLLRGEFKSIVPMVSEALKQDQEHLGAWLHALLFAFDRQPSDSLLKALADDGTLPADARAVLALELGARNSPRETARAALVRKPDAPIAYLDYYRPKKLIDLGYSADALALLDRASTLNFRDRALLVLRASAAQPDRPKLRANFDRLIAGTPLPFNIVDLLSVHLVAHPDRELSALLIEAVQKHGIANAPQQLAAHVSLLCAAGAGGDAGQIRAALTLFRKAAGDELKSFNIVEAFFLRTGSGARIETILPLLQPLSAEMNYALLARYHKARESAEPPATAR